MAPPGYRIRRARADEFHIIAGHRAAMFRDMGLLSEEEAVLLSNASEPWIAGLLANEAYIGWLAEHENAVVAGAGIWLRESGPVPGCYRVGRWAHVVNVYTKPDHRRRGLARSLMNELLNWCASHEVDQITLTASDEGRPLYESLGFAQAADMKLPAPRR